jgi:hypothetical protein
MPLVSRLLRVNRVVNCLRYENNVGSSSYPSFLAAFSAVVCSLRWISLCDVMMYVCVYVYVCVVPVQLDKFLSRSRVSLMCCEVVWLACVPDVVCVCVCVCVYVFIFFTWYDTHTVTHSRTLTHIPHRCVSGSRRAHCTLSLSLSMCVSLVALLLTPSYSCELVLM